MLDEMWPIILRICAFLCSITIIAVLVVAYSSIAKAFQARLPEPTRKPTLDSNYIIPISLILCVILTWVFATMWLHAEITDSAESLLGDFIYLGSFWLATVLLLLGLIRVTRKKFPRLIRQNFMGNEIPVIGGLPLMLLGGLFLCFTLWIILMRVSDSDPIIKINIAYAEGLIGFGILGLIDDFYGDRSVGGFRGHIQKLLNERKITTGLIKMVGGGIVALIVGYQLMLYTFFADWGGWSGPADTIPTATVFNEVLYVAVYGVLIALSANSLNLIDLRPGRTTFAFISLTIIILFFVGFGSDTGSLLLAVTIGIYLFDRAGKIMLGDCGSNALGAVIGVLYCLCLPFWGVCVGVVLLLAFNIWCEKHSVNKLIEETPWLRSLDRKIGVR